MTDKLREAAQQENQKKRKPLFAEMIAQHPGLAEELEQQDEQTEQEPVAMRYDYDGYGYKYIDAGSGSDWQTRVKGAEPVFAAPTPPAQRGCSSTSHVGLTDDEIEDLARGKSGHSDFARAVIEAYETKNGINHG